MSTRFYLHSDAAPYTPSTMRGAWDLTAGSVTKRLSTAWLPYSPMTYVQVAETSTDGEYDVLLYRGVSGPLAAGTIGTGTVNVMLGLYESNAAADDHIHLHIFVTQGDSDTVRGTLLSDYREAAGTNELGTSASAAGMDLNADAALSSVSVSDGDRLVVEIGYTARNTSATSYSARLAYGYPPDAVALAHGGAYQSGVGYVEFSETFADPTTTLASQVLAEALEAQTAAVRVSQSVVELAVATVVESRLSQLVAELVLPVVIESRVSQVAIETLNGGINPSHVSQVIVEILGRITSYCGTPSVSPATLCGKPDVLAWMEWSVPQRES